jgi:MFS family permease
LFKRTPRGRLIVSAIGVLLGAAFLALAINTPIESRSLFVVLLSLTALFMPFPGPNLIASVYDITLPEVRSTALAVQLFIENAGAALAPWIAGLIALRASLGAALLLICTAAWMLCFIFYVIAAYVIPRDLAALRAQLRERADRERAGQASQGRLSP